MSHKMSFRNTFVRWIGVWRKYLCSFLRARIRTYPCLRMPHPRSRSNKYRTTYHCFQKISLGCDSLCRGCSFGVPQSPNHHCLILVLTGRFPQEPICSTKLGTVDGIFELDPPNVPVMG